MKRHDSTGDGNSTVHPAELGTRAPDPITVEARTTLSTALLPPAWWLYEDAFADINPRAAQRHLMTFDEFSLMAHDPRVLKFCARERGMLRGLSVMTDQLDAWTLVAPEFFERRFPGRKVFYVGFVATLAHEPGVYEALVRRMYDDVIAADGIAVMDFCLYNVTDKQIDRRVDLLLRRINPAARHDFIDTQSFHAWDFRTEDGGDAVL